MLNDLPRYARHVRRLAFLFGQELGPDPHRLGWVARVNLHYLGFLSWMEDAQGGLPIAVEDCWSHRISELRELGGVDNGSGELVMLTVARVGVREGVTYGDDAV